MEDHKYYLRKRVGEQFHYYKWINNSLVLDATKREIKVPYNWKDLELSWKRGELNKGILQAESLPVEFVADGAKIVRELHALYNVYAEAELYIEVKYSTDLTYMELFRGMLNFSKFLPDFKDGSKKAVIISVPVLESELERFLSSNGNTKYDVPFDLPTVKRGYVHPVKTRTIYKCIGAKTEDRFEGGTRINTPNLNFAESLTIGDQKSLLGKNVSSAYMEGLDLANMEYQISLFTAMRPLTITITGSLDYTHEALSSGGAADDVLLQLRIRSYVGGDVNVVGINGVLGAASAYTPKGTTVSGTMTINQTYNLDKGDMVEIWFHGEPKPSKSAEHHFTIAAGWELTLDTTFVVDHSTFLGYRPFDLWEYVVTKKLAPGYKFRSDFLKSSVYYFDAAPSLDLITCGRQVAGETDISMKVSYNDLRTDITARYNAAVGIEGDTIVVEHIQDFFRKDSVIFEVRDFTNLRYSTYEDALASELQVGYEEEKNRNKYDGADEPHGKHINSTSQKQSTNVVKWICPFRSIMSQFENMRDNVGKTRKQDKDPDENIFLMQTEAAANSYTVNGSSVSAYPIKKGGTIAGVEFPDTHYGLFHSPKRILRRKDIYIKSMLYNPANINQVVKFESTGKNAFVGSKFPSSVHIIERENVDYTNFSSLLFKPYVIELDTTSHKYQQAAALAQNPYGVIRIKTKHGDVDGFVLDVTYKTAQKGLATYRLLCSPNTEIEVLKKQIL